MTVTTMRAPGLSPELRTAGFYFTIYMTAGVATAYSGIWFAHKGLGCSNPRPWAATGTNENGPGDNPGPLKSDALEDYWIRPLAWASMV